MILKLEDYCQFTNGGSWSADEYTTSGVPVLKVSNFNSEAISFEELSYLDQSGFEKYKRHKLQLHDIVIATVGSHPSLINSAAGRVIVIPHSAVGLLLNQNAVCLRTKDPSILDQRYLGYFCKTQLFQSFIQQRGKGAANQMRIPISGIKSFEFDFPEVSIQRKIANILSAYDDLIENNLKRIKLLEEYTQLTYEEWFVKFRFPHSEEKEFDVNIGLPEGWEIIEFGDFSKIKKGKNITKSTITLGSIPVIAGGLSPAYYHNVANTKSPVITVSASGANAGFTQIHLYDVWASDCSYIDSEMSSYIFFTYCTMLFNKTKILNLQKGAAQPHVYPKDIARIKIIKPDIVTLKSFENFAKVNYQMIGNLLSQNQLLKEARDILLPCLMTGMIEV